MWQSIQFQKHQKFKKACLVRIKLSRPQHLRESQFHCQINPLMSVVSVMSKTWRRDSQNFRQRTQIRFVVRKASCPSRKRDSMQATEAQPRQWMLPRQAHSSESMDSMDPYRTGKIRLSLHSETLTLLKGSAKKRLMRWPRRSLINTKKKLKQSKRREWLSSLKR